MVLCLLPVTALAANGTGHQISVNIYKVVLDSSKPQGYQNPKFVTNITVICQDATAHSGFNHSVNLKEFYPTNFGLTTTDWTGWQFNGYYEKGKDKATFYDWTREQVNATANVTGSEPYPCSKNFYLVYKEAAPQTQDITLTYDANGGSGAPASETKNVEIGKGATFTVSSVKPTRNNYDFKGWSTDRNAKTASYHGGDSITISQDTTLYAVWANHEHKDENDDGYCDTDRECMHEKDQDGYCTVDGCTHPHEGDGACCPKKPDNKPNPPKPENTPAIPGLTELNEVVKVKCNTAPESHKEKTFGFNWFSCQVGEVIANADDEYFCTITVLPNGYVASYNLVYPGHTLDPEGQKETLSLKWNATAKQWENTESNKLPITFTVKCDTVEPTEPPKPNATDIPRIVGNGAVKVHCNANTEHKDEIYGLLEDSFDIGDVTKDEVSGEYTCTITVQPDKYVAAYNGVYAGHTLAPADQTGKITLRWNPNVGLDGTGTWEVDRGVPVEFKVVCVPVHEKVIVTFNSNGGTAVAPQTIAKGGKATKPANPTMDGYTFVNWYLDGKVYDFNTLVNEDITLYAQWKKNDDNPGQDPNPDPSPDPSPKPNPGGHDHGGSTVVVPITVYMPPKTGDMPFWYSIAQFLGLVK